MEGLKKFFKNPNKRAKVLSELVFSADPTIAKIEEDEFTSLVIKNLKEAIPSAETMKQHFKKYSYVHSAYGASGYTLDNYAEKYNDLAKLGIKNLLKKQKKETKSFNASIEKRDKLLEIIKKDEILVKNISYMAKMLRDKNKALMGSTNEWEKKIFKEITKRTQVCEEDLAWYLLQEIATLVVDGKKLDQIVIAKRKHGVVFIRQEYLGYSYLEAEAMVRPHSDSAILVGVCASRGAVKGRFA
jgi:hypothetical protein